MKVTLINPPVREKQYPDQFPIGLAYVASVLLKNGHTVNVIDIRGKVNSEAAVIIENERRNSAIKLIDSENYILISNR